MQSHTYVTVTAAATADVVSMHLPVDTVYVCCRLPCCCCWPCCCREETEEGWKISWDVILHLPGREQRAAECAALQQGTCPRELIRQKTATKDGLTAAAAAAAAGTIAEEEDGEEMDVVPGFDDDESNLSRAGWKSLSRQGSGGRFRRASMDVVADAMRSLFGFGHHSSPSNEMQQQQDEKSDAVPSKGRRGSLELPAMQRQQQGRRSMGQRFGAAAALHEELHGFEGRSASFSQDGTAWATIPFTGMQEPWVYASPAGTDEHLTAASYPTSSAAPRRLLGNAVLVLVKKLATV
jgi:hypothetical protein